MEGTFGCDEGCCGIECEAGNGGTRSEEMVEGAKETGDWLKFSGKVAPILSAKLARKGRICNMLSLLCETLQWWPIETGQQKRFLLCISNH